jgi:hypothetical protein
MKRRDLLKKRQLQLKEEVKTLLDSFLMGTVAKSPSMLGYNLTTKVRGKTVTLYVRKSLVPQAREMSRHYAKMWTLVQKLSRLNWEILQMENQ